MWSLLDFRGVLRGALFRFDPRWIRKGFRFDLAAARISPSECRFRCFRIVERRDAVAEAETFGVRLGCDDWR